MNHKELIQKACNILEREGFRVDQEVDISFSLTPSMERKVISKIAKLHEKIKQLERVLMEGILFRVDVVGQRGKTRVAVECGDLSYRRRLLVNYFPEIMKQSSNGELYPAHRGDLGILLASRDSGGGRALQRGGTTIGKTPFGFNHSLTSGAIPEIWGPEPAICLHGEAQKPSAWKALRCGCDGLLEVELMKASPVVSY